MTRAGVTTGTRPRWTKVAGWWTATVALELAIAWFTFVNFDDSMIASYIPTTAQWVSAIVVGAALLLRTRAPWIFLLVAVSVYLYFTVFTPALLPSPPILFALGCAVYAVASTLRMRNALLLGLGVEVLLIGAGILAKNVSLLHVYTLPTSIAIVAGVGIGQLVHSRRVLTETADRRADDAERTREALASARVAEQRLATARDLHDLVSHRVAAINFHASAARREIPPESTAALRSLDTIQESAHQILEEIADLLAELRDVPISTDIRSPGHDELASLAKANIVEDLPVDLEIDGAVLKLPDAVRSTVYRIVQEGIANACKHGSGDAPTKVRACVDSDSLLIRVSNPVPRSPSEPDTSSGYGLIGVRERARALGGQVRAGLEGDRFELVVTIPLRFG